MSEPGQSLDLMRLWYVIEDKSLYITEPQGYEMWVLLSTARILWRTDILAKSLPQLIKLIILATLVSVTFLKILIHFVDNSMCICIYKTYLTHIQVCSHVRK